MVPEAALPANDTQAESRGDAAEIVEIRPGQTPTTASSEHEQEEDGASNAEEVPPVTGRSDGLVATETRNGSRDGKPSLPEPGASPEGLRQANNKIASIKAAYELRAAAAAKSSFGSPQRRVDRRPMANADQVAEIERLKEQLEMESALRLAFEEKSAGLEDKCTSLEARSTALEGEVGALRTRLVQTDERWLARYEELQKELAQRKSQAVEDADHNQRQLSELKRNLSVATKTEAQVSDSHFVRETGLLYHEIQNWVVRNFRRVKIEKSPDEMCAFLERISDLEQLAILRPVYEKFVPADKIAIFQATVGCYLMEVFEDAVLFGLPHQEWRRGIRRAVEGLPSVLSPAAFNSWRSMTLDLIRKSTDAIATSVESAAESLAEMICIILTGLCEVEDSENRVASLVNIIRRAISLSHLFRAQRALYVFKLPVPGSKFDPAAMEDTRPDADSKSAFTVRCGLFPTVMKLGEGDDDEQVANVVIRAKVLCSDF